MNIQGKLGQNRFALLQNEAKLRDRELYNVGFLCLTAVMKQGR